MNTSVTAEKDQTTNKISNKKDEKLIQKSKQQLKTLSRNDE